MTAPRARSQSTTGAASEQVVIPCLEPAEAAALLKAALLLEPMPHHPVVILLIVSAALVVAVAAVAAWFPLAVLGIPLAAVALTTLSVAVHEAAHGSLFRRHWANTAVGFVAGVVTFTPFGSYRRGHRAHHRWTGSSTGKDPTAAPLEPVRATRFLDFALALRVPVLFWGGVYLPYLVYDLQPTDSPRRTAHVIGYVANLGVIVAAHVLLASIVGWVPYALVAVGGFVGWSVLYEELFTRHQHVGLLPLPRGQSRYRTTEQAQFSRSVRIPAPWLFFYFNLHKEHHLFPGLPYRYLPRVRDLLRRARPDVAGFTSADRRRPARAHELLTPQPGDP
jgi:omega-6 fatty acid desaturase (delta-12 desaturase)